MIRTSLKNYIEERAIHALMVELPIFLFLLILKIRFPKLFVFLDKSLIVMGLTIFVTSLLWVIAKLMTPHISIELINRTSPDSKELVLYKGGYINDSTILQLKITTNPTKFFRFIIKRLQKYYDKLFYCIEIPPSTGRIIEEKIDGNMKISIIKERIIKIDLFSFIPKGKYSASSNFRIFVDNMASCSKVSFESKKRHGKKAPFIYLLIYYLLLKISYKGLKNLEIKPEYLYS